MFIKFIFQFYKQVKQLTKFSIEPTYNLDAAKNLEVSFFSISFSMFGYLEQQLNWLLVCMYGLVLGYWWIADDVTILELWLVFGVYLTFFDKMS